MWMSAQKVASRKWQENIQEPWGAGGGLRESLLEVLLDLGFKGWSRGFWRQGADYGRLGK